MAELSVENLNMTYYYGAKAIDNLTFSVKENECISILGEAESGKTSLLKCIAGLYPASSGTIKIKGKDITNLKIKDRNILLLFDDCGIIKNKSIRFNLEYPLKIRKVARKYRRKLVEKIANEHKILPLLTDRGRMLYERDRVRIAVARLSIRESAAVLVDDIFKCLPSDIRRDSFLEMLPYLKNIKSPIVFATTSVDEAFTMSNKIIVMRYGIMEQMGTRNQLLSVPKSLYVERLINKHKNQKEVEVCSDDSGCYVEILNKKIYDIRLEKYLNKSIIVSFSLCESGKGRIYQKEYETYCGGVCSVVLENGMTILASNIKSGYCIEVDLESVNFFDTQTEQIVE